MTYVRLPLRRLVSTRARGICEYCLIAQEDSFLGCEIEHIISEKHGGKTTASNLAWACAECNRFKGSDIATISPGSRKLCRLFNPRTDRWGRHFKLKTNRIVGISEVGKATVSLLDLNTPERMKERQMLLLIGRFPPVQARRLLDDANES